MDAYEEAEKVDKVIRDVVQKNGISGNERAFRLFSRTIRTTLDLVDAATEDKALIKRLEVDDGEQTKGHKEKEKA